MKFEFKHVDGKIILVTTLQVWGGDVTNEIDVTDKVMPVVDDMLDFHLGLSKDGEYKHKGTRLNYVGENKN